MVKQENKSSDKLTDKDAAWLDKLNFSQLWLQLLHKASLYYSEGDFENYINTIKILIVNLFKPERDKVEKLMKRNFDFDFEKEVDAYYSIHKKIIDVLYDAGYLSKELTTIAETMRFAGADSS